MVMAKQVRELPIALRRKRKRGSGSFITGVSYRLSTCVPTYQIKLKSAPRQFA